VWFQVEESAPHDPRIRLLARRLGITRGDAFLACCLVWCWLYKRGGGDEMATEEVDTVGENPGLAGAMVEVGLADPIESGVRIRGGKRAKRYAAFCALQKKRALEREAAKREQANNGAPVVLPNEHQGGSLSLLVSGSGSQSPERSAALARQASKRAADAAAAGEWVEWFNRRFARAFTVTPELVKAVGALLARGYSEKPDMRGVALYLRSRWEGSDEMRHNLVPSTILRITKFPERLDLAKEWDRQSGAGIWGAQ